MKRPVSASLPLLLVLSALAVGCAKRDQAEAPAATQAAAPGGVATPGGGELRVVGRQMRVTLSVSLRVDDVAASAGALRKQAAELGGFVADASLHEDRGRVRNGTLTLRVPTSKLDALRAEAGRLGKITSENEKAEDVTEQVTDLDARLRNARAREKRLLEMLEGRTGALADVLAVEKELSAAREAVERLDAQKKALDGEVAFATVHVSLGEVGDALQAGAGARIARAARDGVENLASLAVVLAVVVASAGPSLLALAGAGWLIFLAIRWGQRLADRRARRALGG